MKQLLLCAAIVFTTLFVPVLAAQTDTDAQKLLAAYEMKYFEHPYNGETIERRLERLESFIFGDVSAGSPEGRLAKIEEVVGPPGQSAQTTTQSNTSQQQPSVSQSPPSIAPGGSPGDYPHVTTLETEILGNTYISEPVTTRLDRLEAKAFGKPSGKTDLADRTDALEDYAEQKLHKKSPYVSENDYGMGNGFSGGGAPQKRSAGDFAAFVAQGLSSIASAALPVPYVRFHGPEQTIEDPQETLRRQQIDQQNQAAESKAPPTNNERTLSRVAWCEKQMFGRTYPELHLLQRLRQLDTKLFPGDKTKDFDLMDKIDTLVKAVVMLKQPHEPQSTSNS